MTVCGSTRLTACVLGVIFVAVLIRSALGFGEALVAVLCSPC
jgi:hypothetical protein